MPNYAALVVRNERRVRLAFSSPLAAGAFGSNVPTLAALYQITCTNGVGLDPTIVSAIRVPGAPDNVELALSLDLVTGGAYAVASNGVPALDTTLSPPASDTFLFGALPAPSLNIEQSSDDLDALVFGVDLVWTGADFLETPTGDLATVQGLPNAQGAQQRRLLNEDALPWAQNYGVQAGAYVEGPSGGGLSLLARLNRQAVADDRVASATVDFVEDDANPGDVYFPVTTNFKGIAPTTPPFVLNVPFPTST